MKKHILGIGVFSLIVAFAVVLSNLFFVEKEVNYPIYGNDYSSKKTTCFRKPDPNKFRYLPKVQINQSEIDLQTKNVKTSISISPKTDKNYAVALHFFAKDGSKTRYITTSKILVKPDFNEVTESIRTSSDYLDGLDNYENLYVVPESVTNLSPKIEFTPEFNYETAAPVVVAKGKRR